jgi:acyl-coenzyme A thioesterase PaaI-like protein
MDLTQLLATDDRSLTLAPLTDAVRSPAGCASLGMVVTMIDVGASDPAMVACRPDWTATQDLSLHSAGWITDGPIVVDTELVRVGTKVVVVAVTVHDGNGVEDVDALRGAIDDGTLTRAAAGLVTYARIPGAAAPGMDDYDPGRWAGQIRRNPVAAPAAGTMYQRMGLELLDARTGRMQLEHTPYLANSIGTINGGAQAVLLEAAAEAMRPGMAATDMQIHYLSQMKAGPVRTVGTVLRDAADHSVVTMELVDGGNDDQLLAVATIILQTPSRRGC